MEEDPLDSLLGLEEDYYQEGYNLGETDGAHAGYVEGKLFGIEKGYEKALEMGRMYGKATVWKYRLSQKVNDDSDGTNNQAGTDFPDLDRAIEELSKLSDSSRIPAQIDQLLSITDVQSLSTGNDDDSVADFDDRLKRAAAKIKIISRVIGERDLSNDVKKHGDGSGNIEDVSSLSIRH